MSALPPILVELKASSGEFMAKMGEARHEISKLNTEGSQHFQKVAQIGKAALLGIAGVATAVGGASLELADQFEKSHARLEAALTASGTSFDAWKGQVGDADKRLEALGFTNTQTEGALGNLVIALQDPAKAMQVLGTAADLARAKNIDLGTASTMVAKAMEGNTRALKQMGIDLPINAKSTEQLKVAQNQLRFAQETYQSQLTRLHEKHKVTAADLQTVKVAHDRVKFAQEQVNQATHAGTLILDALNKRLHGQSDAYAESFAGKVQVLKTQLEDLGIKIGLALIPLLEKLVAVIETTVQWLEKHRAVAIALGAVIGGALLLAITAYAVAMATAAAATIAATWPIIAIIAAAAALAAGIYELYKHWTEVWGFIKRITSDAAQWVKQHLLMIAVAFGPVGLAAFVLYKNWDKVWSAIKAVTLAVWNDFLHPVFNLIGAAFRLVGAVVSLVYTTVWRPQITAMGDIAKALWNGAIKPVAGYIGGAFHVIGSALSVMYNQVWRPMWSGIVTVVRGVWTVLKPILDAIGSAISGITSGINAVTGAVNHLKGGGGLLGKIASHIPGLASGTDHWRGGLTWVGENGPELLNLPRGAQVIPNGRSMAMAGGGLVELHVYLDGKEITANVRQNTKRYSQRNSGTGF